MGKDLVSVVIPTYNRPIFLKRALDSIKNQTHQEYEVIIVDDNGFESEMQLITQNIVEPWLSEKVKYVVNAKNVGAAVSRNNGVNNSTGQYITFLDDDDEYEPDKLEKQVNLIKKYDKDH